MTVVHCAKQVCTKYCGRPTSRDRAMGKPEDFSVLGNPFSVDNYPDGEAIRKHRIYLWEQLQKDTPVRRAMLKLEDNDVLGCFCAPKPCHCDTIAAAYEWLKTQPCFNQ